MNIDEVHSYEQLKLFLEKWTNFGGGPPYDFMGAFHLLLAMLTNLANHYHDGDLEGLQESAPWLSEPQRKFLDDILRIG